MNPVLVPEGAVHELLGIKKQPNLRLAAGVHFNIYNWNGRRLLDRQDVLRWLQAKATATDSPLLFQLHNELADITAKGD